MTNDELLVLEHATLLEEFKTARENMLFDVAQSRQIVNITLTAASILVVGASFIIQYNVPVLFLIAPFIFYTLAWYQIRNLRISNLLNQYLLTVLIPRIQAVLKELSRGEKRNFDHIMSWEAYLEADDHRNRLILLPIAGGNYGITLLAAFFTTCAYFAVVYGKIRTIPTIDLILIIVNAILIIYSVSLGLWARFSIRRSQLSDTIQKKRSLFK
jgi:hypothetical protein